MRSEFFCWTKAWNSNCLNLVVRQLPAEEKNNEKQDKTYIEIVSRQSAKRLINLRRIYWFRYQRRGKSSEWYFRNIYSRNVTREISYCFFTRMFHKDNKSLGVPNIKYFVVPATTRRENNSRQRKYQHRRFRLIKSTKTIRGGVKCQPYSS